MSNILSYTLDLKGNMTSTMQKIGAESKNVKNGLEQVSGAASGLGNIFKMVGISFGAFQIFNMTKEGVEKVHALHQAEAQLANTMQNMGVYSQEAYEKAIKGAVDMSKSVLFSKSEIIGLQSQLRMVGNIGEGEMSKLAMASADMATKFGMGLTEAGNAIAKAVNNPEMMRRLAMQLKIDPNLVDKIQAIAKAGNEAKARLMLIDVVQQKVGGAAQAAFNADPLARYNKTMGSIKMTLGEVAVSIQKTLAPVMEVISVIFQNTVKWTTDALGTFFNKLKNGEPVITSITLAVGALTAAIVGYRLVMLSLAGIHALVVAWKSILVAYEIVIFAVKNATSLWTAAQWLLDVALDANPVGLIIARIVAIIAVISYLIYKIDGWGAAWKHTVSGAKLIFLAYVEYIKSSFNTVVDGIMIGINKIKEGWYKFKIAVGIGDKSENQKMLDQIQADTKARQKSILDGYKKTAEYSKQAGAEFIAASGSFSWNDKSVSGGIDWLKNKIGISAPGVPGTNTTGVGGTGGAMGSGGTASNAGKDTANSIATGGTKTTNVTINLGSLISGGFTVNSRDIREGASKVRDVVLDELTRVLSMAQGQAI